MPSAQADNANERERMQRMRNVRCVAKYFVRDIYLIWCVRFFLCMVTQSTQHVYKISGFFTLTLVKSYYLLVSDLPKVECQGTSEIVRLRQYL